MSARPGDYVYVTYGEEPELYHTRLLVGHVHQGQWVVVTPTFDVYVEDFGTGNEDIEAIRYGPSTGQLPVGMHTADVFMFAPALVPAQVTALIAEGERLASIERANLGGVAAPALAAAPPPLPPPAAVPAPAAVVPAAPAPPAAPVVAAVPVAAVPHPGFPTPAADGTLPPSHVWVVADEMPGDGRVMGAVLEVGPQPGQARLLATRGRKALVECADGSSVFVYMVATTDLGDFVKTWRGEDARVLAVKRVNGSRHREWRDVSDSGRQEDFADFPIAKPRTAKWCTEYLIKNGGPAQHSEIWRSRRRLQPTEFGVDMHDTLAKIAEYMGTYDQLDLRNLASAEYLFRKMQMVEHYYDEKDLDNFSGNPKLPAEEARAFVGGGRPVSMVAPELLDYVSKELERVSGIKKNARKLREEQAALRSHGGGGGGGGGNNQGNKNKQQPQGGGDASK